MTDNRPKAIIIFKSGRMIEVPYEVFDNLIKDITKDNTVSIFEDKDGTPFLLVRHDDVSCIVLRQSPVSISGALE